jgi:RimJ/RimL family protein N-acetyltransferase
LKGHLQFTPQYQVSLEWRGHKLRLGSVLPANKHQISNGLKDLSHESIRNRFMGSKKEFSETELRYLTEVDGWNHYAIGIEEQEGNKRGVALARMVRSESRPEEAEIAITIIDEYQRLGLGSMLIKLIALASEERDISRLSYTYLPQNDGIIRLIQKLGKTHFGEHQMDWVHAYQNVSEIDLKGFRSQLAPYLPKTGTSDLKT